MFEQWAEHGRGVPPGKPEPREIRQASAGVEASPPERLLAYASAAAAAGARECAAATALCELSDARWRAAAERGKPFDPTEVELDNLRRVAQMCNLSAPRPSDCLADEEALRLLVADPQRMLGDELATEATLNFGFTGDGALDVAIHRRRLVAAGVRGLWPMPVERRHGR